MKKQLTERHPAHIQKKKKYICLTPYHQIGKLGQTQKYLFFISKHVTRKLNYVQHWEDKRSWITFIRRFCSFKCWWEYFCNDETDFITGKFIYLVWYRETRIFTRFEKSHFLRSRWRFIWTYFEISRDRRFIFTSITVSSDCQYYCFWSRSKL